MENDDAVYVGIWTNYSKGRVLGATLTISQQQGALLIALTGFLIPFVASRFWKLSCIIFHRFYSTSTPRNAIHHQRQVTLRNSSSPDSGLVSLFRILWAWGWNADRKDLLFTILPSLLFSTACIIVFSAAGALSSQVSVSAGNEILLRGDNCGIPTYSSFANTSTLSYDSNLLSDSVNYAQQCYNANVSGILSCNKFVTQSIPTVMIKNNAECPFQNDLCRGNKTSLYLDTGYIDSNRHLGLNLPLDKGFAYRHAITCSPIETSKYTTRLSTGNKTAVEYDYVDSTVTSLTYQGEAILEPDYFVPIAGISRHDGDVFVAFLSGDGVYFAESMNDDWYRATTTAIGYVRGVGPSNQSHSVYMPTEAASPLGCVEQYQWCNTAYSNNSGCGPLASNLDALYGAAPFFNLSEKEFDLDRPSSESAVGTRLIWPSLITISTQASIGVIVEGLGAKSLASQNLLYNGVQFPLPMDQWQIDVANWMNISLALLQLKLVDTALGTSPDKLQPVNHQERKLCHSQKIQSTTYSNFNLLGLLVIYIASSLIITTSFIVEPILACLFRRHKHQPYEYIEWTINESLQLHRLAQEEAGQQWSKGTNKVPITSPGNMLAPIDISNPEHPVLARPRQDTSDEEKAQAARLLGSYYDHLSLSGYCLSTHCVVFSSQLARLFSKGTQQ
ncbi:hypothetical protein F5Y16DRAFT_421824 [Xylariaceae sp. FL0255]|nr:hypothetical protein F5Y16DRAFT_421824 [Xylariaceae sp. FL0255]